MRKVQEMSNGRSHSMKILLCSKHFFIVAVVVVVFHRKATKTCFFSATVKSFTTCTQGAFLDNLDSDQNCNNDVSDSLNYFTMHLNSGRIFVSHSRNIAYQLCFYVKSYCFVRLNYCKKVQTLSKCFIPYIFIVAVILNQTDIDLSYLLYRVLDQQTADVTVIGRLCPCDLCTGYNQ